MDHQSAFFAPVDKIVAPVMVRRAADSLLRNIGMTFTGLF